MFIPNDTPGLTAAINSLHCAVEPFANGFNLRTLDGRTILACYNKQGLICLCPRLFNQIKNFIQSA